MTKWLLLGTQCRFYGKPAILTAIDGASGTNPVRIATLNPEILLTQQEIAPEYRVLDQFTHHTVDGFCIVLAAFWRSVRIPQRYPGASMVEDLLTRYQNGEKSFYFLGGLGSEAEQAAKNLRARFPKISIVGAESGGAIKLGAQPESALIQRITKANPDILLVGFGAPKQEWWISQAASRLTTPVMIGVGGTFGFYSTKQRAAPTTQPYGLEWLTRTLREPGHFRRLWRAIIVFAVKVVFTRG